MHRNPIRLMLTLAILILPAATAFADSYKGTVSFPLDELQMNRSCNFDLPFMKDAGGTTQVGAPSMPVMQTHLALPPGATNCRIGILSLGSIELEGSYDILPVTAPKHISAAPSPTVFYKDPAVYDRSEYYPSMTGEVVQTWDLAGQAFVTLQFYPLKINPVTGKAVLYTRIDFEVTYDVIAGPQRTYNFSPTVRRELTQRLRALAHNPEDVPEIARYAPGLAASLESGQYDYLIITISNFINGFQPLADWRTERGMKAKIVDLNWIYANYPDGTDCRRVRDFITDAQAEWGVLYVLLGGDTAYIPYNLVNIDGDNIPNDTYYGDYDKDWKYEVYVGRACVNNTSQVSTFVNKVLTYEKNPPSGFGEEYLFLGFDLDGSTDGEICKKVIENNWVPAWADFAREYDSESGGHESDTKAYLNAGKNLVNHIDHCNTGYVGVGSVNHGTGFDLNDAQSFTNGTRYTNFYTLGCWPGNYESTCWGEAFTLDDQGGITFTGNSRYGWYQSGSTIQLSFKYDMEWWEALYADNAYRAGETLAVGLNNYTPLGTLKYIFTELNLLGDPGLHMWTDVPDSLTVTHASSYDLGSPFFTVNVKSGASNLQGALVCLVKGDEIYETGITDAFGNADLTVHPTTAGDMTVTVTAQNHKYYQSTVSLSAPLLANTDTLSVSGGSVQLSLDAKAANGGRDYLILGSLSGTAPGTPLPGGAVTLPLNWDALTNTVIANLNTSLFSGFLGVLDGAGTASAQINTGVLSSSKIGKTMHYAYLLGEPFDYVSNAVGITFVP